MIGGAGGSLDEGLVPLIASRVQENKHTKFWQRNLAVLRMVCRQWAAESTQGCTRLKIDGEGPMGWEHRFCGLEELDWWQPDSILANPGQCWPKLKSLRLRNFDDGDLQKLRDMPGLTSLDLGDCEYYTDAGLKELGHLTALTSLDLTWRTPWGITDAGLKELGHMTALQSLNLFGCHITDAGLEGLGHMTSLTTLNLRNCFHITDAGLKELRGMTSLISLDLYGCRNITDAGLMELGRMTSLTSLILDGCEKITDDGLKELGRMTALESLDLSYCNQTTEAGRRELAEQLPNLSRDGICYVSDTPIDESDEDSDFDSDDGG